MNRETQIPAPERVPPGSVSPATGNNFENPQAGLEEKRVWFEAEIKKNLDRFKRLALKLLMSRPGAEHLAEDLVQQASLNVWKVYLNGQFQHRSQLATYFSVVLKRLAADMYRRSPAYLGTDYPRQASEHEYDNVPDDADFEKMMADRNLVNDILSYLRSSASDKDHDNNLQMDIFRMRFVEGMKFEEITEQLGLKLEHVKTLHYRLRKKIKKKFGQRWEEQKNG